MQGAFTLYQSLRRKLRQAKHQLVDGAAHTTCMSELETNSTQSLHMSSAVLNSQTWQEPFQRIEKQ